MQRLGGGGYPSRTRKRKARGGGNNPSCGCDMQAGWPKFLTENIPMPSVGPSQKGGGSCGIPPIPNYYNGRGMKQQGGSCAACSGLPLPVPMQQGGGQPAAYNSNPVPDACPFPGTGYCNFYARGGRYGKIKRGGANYGEPMYLQARLRGGANGNNNASTISNTNAETIYNENENEEAIWQAQQNMEEYRQQMINAQLNAAYVPNNNNNNRNNNSNSNNNNNRNNNANRNNNPSPLLPNAGIAAGNGNDPGVQEGGSNAHTNEVRRRAIEQGRRLAAMARERRRAAAAAGLVAVGPQYSSENARVAAAVAQLRAAAQNPQPIPQRLGPVNNDPSAVVLNELNIAAEDPTVQEGGGCGCTSSLFRGGYRPTKKNLKALKRYRRGESIGFTMTSSLKAKGLIPRTSKKHKGKKVISAKYK